MANHNASGSWGDPAGSEFRDTAVVLEALRLLNQTGNPYVTGLSVLASLPPVNNDDLARQAAALARNGADVTAAVNDLLAGQNAARTGVPNSPEGGWGLAAGYASDVLDTALPLDALHAAGLAGGLSVAPKTIAAGATHQYQYTLPQGVTDLALLFNPVSGSIQVRIRAGSPPTLADPYYVLTGPAYLGGIPMDAGTYYIRVDGAAATSTYGIQVTYTANGFDTASLLTPINYLTAAQRADGGWGLSVGADASNIYLTAEALLTLARYKSYFDLTAAVNGGAQWLKGQQNPDGGWGQTTAESAISFYALSVLGTQPNDPVGAINKLLGSQAPDGSWNGQPYDTALAVLALAGRTPAAVAGLTISKAAASVVLNWSPVTTNALGDPMTVDHYNIYRSPSPYYMPSPATLYGTSVTAFFTDAGALNSGSGNYYYFVAAVGAGGVSGVSSGQVGKFEFSLPQGQ